MRQSRPDSVVRADFWKRVNKNGAVHPRLGTSCWEWQSALSYGYGVTSVDGSARRAHRVSWEEEHGPISDGLCVLHKCDNRKCVRPDHLFLGTRAENTADMVAKGRSAAGDKNGSRRYPERLPRGDLHPARAHPERLCRGEDSPKAKLKEADVVLIRNLVANGEKQASVSRRIGISVMSVSLIVRRQQWKHVPMTPLEEAVRAMSEATNTLADEIKKSGIVGAAVESDAITFAGGYLVSTPRGIFHRGLPPEQWERVQALPAFAGYEAARQEVLAIGREVARMELEEWGGGSRNNLPRPP